MEPYSFWQDFFASYRSSPDAIKALWLIVPPAFVVALTWVVLNAPLIRLPALFRHTRGEASSVRTPQTNLQRCRPLSPS